MRPHRTHWLFTAAVAALLGSPASPANIPLARQVEADVRILASNDMEGRGLLTNGLQRSADYIEGRLRSLALAPAFGSSYRQPFNVAVEPRQGSTSNIDGVRRKQWAVLPGSGAGSFRAPLVFAGYGISSPTYDDYAEMDVRGKAVLIFRLAPRYGRPDTPFRGATAASTSIGAKIEAAAARGAAAVIFVSGPLHDTHDALPRLRPELESSGSIPAIQVKTSVAQAWLRGAGLSLAGLQRAIDRDLRPMSRVTNIVVSGSVIPDPLVAHTENIAAVLPGRGSLAHEVVILGAHYDHIGYGGETAFDKPLHAIHPGADDNASGTAAVLEAAPILEARLRGAANRRTVVFVLFSAEEEMQLGSRFFVSHPPWRKRHIVAMVNLDMIGSLRDNRLVAFGVDSAPEWMPLLRPAAIAAGLRLGAEGNGFAYNSDQASFYAAGIPSVVFFTRYHDRYHRASDTADALNYGGEATIVEYVADVVGGLAAGAATPHCRNCPAGGPQAQPDRRADIMPADEAQRPLRRALPFELAAAAIALGVLLLLVRRSRRFSARQFPTDHRQP